MLTDAIIYCDGSFKPEKGPAYARIPARGGWGILILYKDGRAVEEGGADLHTTNNRTELLGAIIGLSRLLPGQTAEVRTDSKYVIEGAKAIHAWSARGWTTKTGQPLANVELWQRLLAELVRLGGVTWTWVKGHAGERGNHRVDGIAQSFSAGGKPLLHSYLAEDGMFKFAELRVPYVQTEVKPSKKPKKKRKVVQQPKKYTKTDRKEWLKVPTKGHKQDYVGSIIRESLNQA